MYRRRSPCFRPSSGSLSQILIATSQCSALSEHCAASQRFLNLKLPPFRVLAPLLCRSRKYLSMNFSLHFCCSGFLFRLSSWTVRDLYSDVAFKLVAHYNSKSANASHTFINMSRDASPPPSPRGMSSYILKAHIFRVALSPFNPPI